MFKNTAVIIISCLVLRTLGQITNKTFPKNFMLGAATSAYQIEGGWNEDGKGTSIWDDFTHKLGKIADGSTGDVACDSYYNWKTDVRNLKKLGVQFYRFSISWTRIIRYKFLKPKVNPVGINYYLNLIQELKANNIEPIITLYHWDLPSELELFGGWLNAITANCFSEYARVCFRAFGQHVRYWITLNEPIVQCFLGYTLGTHAPGKTLLGDGAYKCAKNQLLAHAKAYHIYQEEFKAQQRGKLSLNQACSYIGPYDPTSSEDMVAAERLFQFQCGLIANPVYNGNWPQMIIDRINRPSIYPFSPLRLPKFTEREIEFIKGTSDFMAINTYAPTFVADKPGSVLDFPTITADIGVTAHTNESRTNPDIVWSAPYPESIRILLNDMNRRYNPGEIIVTENGLGDSGQLNDVDRRNFLEGYLSNVLLANIEDGVNVTGYTAWSLMDNFEWADGYTKRFGLIAVDFNSANRTRTWKTSATWFQDVNTRRCLTEECE